MKILLASPGFTPPGGVQYVGKLIAEALIEQYGDQLELDLISMNDGENDCQINAVRSWVACRGSKVRFFANLSRMLLHTHDVVVVNHINLIPYFAAMNVICRTKILCVVHGIEAWRKLPVWRRQGFGNVKEILFVSKYSQKRANAANPALISIRQSICHHGIRDTQSKSSGTDTIAIEGSKRFALMIGRMESSEQYKGYDEMIRAWPLVRGQMPDLELWIVGKGNDRERLELLAAHHGEGIRFLGAVSDVEREQLLRSCTCFCLPSRGEGFGLVYLEAMQAGKPVLAGVTDAGPEVVVDHVTGRTVDAQDQASLVNAILQLASPAGRNLGDAGVQRYQEQFTFDAYACRLSGIINEFIRLKDEGAAATCDAI